MWNIYSPSLWETACNLRCTQLRIVHYATMYQSQSVCISRSGFRETGCFYETCCLCAPTSCDGVAPWASDFRPPHTMDTVGRVHWLKKVTYNATSQHCTWSQNLQCNITTLYPESKPTSHGSHERESIVVFDKVPTQLVEQIQNFTQIQFNTLPLWEGFSELAFALDMNRIGENQSCQYLITLKQRTFQPQNAKMCIKNVCTWLDFLIRISHVNTS